MSWLAIVLRSHDPLLSPLINRYTLDAVEDPDAVPANGVDRTIDDVNVPAIDAPYLNFIIVHPDIITLFRIGVTLACQVGIVAGVQGVDPEIDGEGLGAGLKIGGTRGLDIGTAAVKPAAGATEFVIIGLDLGLAGRFQGLPDSSMKVVLSLAPVK